MSLPPTTVLALTIGLALVIGCNGAGGNQAGTSAGALHVTASGGDDTSALQATIDAAASGDTVEFARGDYRLDGVTLKSGVTYRGQPGAVLHASGNQPIFTVKADDSHDIVVDGFAFVGTGADPTTGAVALFGTAAANSVDRIMIMNSTFENNGLTCDYLKNSRIVDNAFRNIGATGTGIHGYHLDDSVLAGGTFTNVYQAIGLVFGGAPDQGRNVVVADNVGTGISRMGIEIIGSDPVYPGETTNLLVEGNHFAGWRKLGAVGDTSAYSIVTDGGSGTRVLDNYARGNPNRGYGIELAGRDAVAKGNYLDGFSTGIIAYSAGSVIEDNNIINYASASTSTYDRSDVIVQNNTSDPSIPPPAAARTRGQHSRGQYRHVTSFP
jgi:hypothetical protein